VFVEWQGRRRKITELCWELQLVPSLVYARLGRGWPLERALSEPVHPSRKGPTRTFEMYRSRIQHFQTAGAT
jgi:hypothetical protein